MLDRFKTTWEDFSQRLCPVTFNCQKLIIVIYWIEDRSYLLSFSYSYTYFLIETNQTSNRYIIWISIYGITRAWNAGGNIAQQPIIRAWDFLSSLKISGSLLQFKISPREHMLETLEFLTDRIDHIPHFWIFDGILGH